MVEDLRDINLAEMDWTNLKNDFLAKSNLEANLDKPPSLPGTVKNELLFY